MPTTNESSVYVKANVDLYTGYLADGKRALEARELRAARDAYFKAHIAAGRIARAYNTGDADDRVKMVLWTKQETYCEGVWEGLSAVVVEMVRLKLYPNDDAPLRVVVRTARKSVVPTRTVTKPATRVAKTRANAKGK